MSHAIYAGTLRHVRLVPRRHEVRHRLALPFVDLDDAENERVGLGRRRPGIVRLRRSDFLPQCTGATLREAVEIHAAHAGLDLERGPIRLLANLRTFGFCFNPAAFFFCLTPDERRVQAILVEVTNTPWQERHTYVLQDPDQVAGGRSRGRVDKAMHVSPFMAMDQTYRWCASNPGERLVVSFTTEHEGRAVFHASLDLERRQVSRAGLTRAAVRRPFPSARTLALIYAHAVALRAKGLPLVGHP